MGVGDTVGIHSQVFGANQPHVIKDIGGVDVGTLSREYLPCAVGQVGQCATTAHRQVGLGADQPRAVVNATFLYIGIACGTDLPRLVVEGLSCDVQAVHPNDHAFLAVVYRV